ncbi:MerR family transcriptional regulator [Hoyosella sp. YIM 151337]|uniref:MerR family transcriptional regulator n=1 Tax=Hoyosella sp. YIM 151337 TaxID=2992742 RepID=UPI0022366C74|nr:MerR family transcriptional regulator [Hoyosella sp. YIM 151337]MCW4353337.1 MerR family transcriptional regulator [Hoyosella sp. YIM 151337]
MLTEQIARPSHHPSVRRGGERKREMKEYRIDDLARAAGISVRNVRVYQDRGLLPPPRKEGRTGWYNESHLSRLRLIIRMLERGYTFATISELLLASQYGMSVEDILETDDLRGPLGFFRAKARGTLGELRKIFGDQTPVPGPERAKELSVLRAEDLLGIDPRLREVAQSLVDFGVPPDRILEQGKVVRDDLRDVARVFVTTITEVFLPDGLQGGASIPLDEKRVAELAELSKKLRPLANRVVDLLFSEVMEIEISKAINRAAAALNGNEPESASDESAQ